MLPGELQAKYGTDPGYQNMLRWIAAGGKHGSYDGLVLNEAAVRKEEKPWGENVFYDAAGNSVSMYRPWRPGDTQIPYAQGGGVSAPAYDPVKSRNAFVPDAFKAKGIAAALAQNPPAPANPLLTALAPQLWQSGETELERQQRLAREAQLGVA